MNLPRFEENIYIYLVIFMPLQIGRCVTESTHTRVHAHEERSKVLILISLTVP